MLVRAANLRGKATHPGGGGADGHSLEAGGTLHEHGSHLILRSKVESCRVVDEDVMTRGERRALFSAREISSSQRKYQASLPRKSALKAVTVALFGSGPARSVGNCH